MREKLLKATSIIIVAAGVSKILGLVREMVLARYFGASGETDAYLVAMIVPAVLFGAVSASLITVLIPVYNEYVNTRGDAEAQRLANTVVNTMLVILAAILGIGLLLAPQIVHIIAPGFGGEQLKLTVKLSRILLPMVMFMGLARWATAILQARQHFTAPALIGIPYNLTLITGIVLGGLHWGITGVAVATLVAVLLQFMIQVPALSIESFHYRLIVDWNHDGLRQIGRLIVPVIIGTSAGTVNLAVDRMLASGLTEGSISALNYANRINQLPFGLVGVAIITVLYPTMTQLAVSEDHRRLGNLVNKGIQLLAFIMVPATVGLFLLRVPIIRLAFERGAFDAHDTELTTYALLFYSFGLLWMAWRELMNRTFYALQDTWTPMVIGIVGVGVNIVANLLLVGPLGHGGLALGTSVAAMVTVGLLYRRLGRVIPSWRIRSIAKGLGKIAAASGVMALAVWYARQSLWTGSLLREVLSIRIGTGALYDLVSLISVVVLGVVIYTVAAWLLRIETLWELVGILKRLGRRFFCADRTIETHEDSGCETTDEKELGGID